MISCPPRFAFGLAKKAASSLGDSTGSNTLGEGALFCGLLETIKWDVSKAKMVGHEESLVGRRRGNYRRRFVVSGEGYCGLVNHVTCTLTTATGCKVGVLIIFLNGHVTAGDICLEGWVFLTLAKGAGTEDWYAHFAMVAD